MGGWKFLFVIIEIIEKVFVPISCFPVFVPSPFSCVELGYREQAVGALSGSMAPATQRVSPMHQTAVSGGAPQKCPSES